MKSMTGFGRSDASKDGTSVIVEIAAVNHKHRDFRFNLPPEMVILEAVLKPIVEESVVRGGLSISVTYSLNAELKQRQVRVDQDVAAHLVKSLQHIAQETGIGSEVRLGDLLVVPGVVVYDETTLPFDLLTTLSKDAMRKALAQLDHTRSVEGEQLTQDILQRIISLEELLEAMRSRQDDALQHHQKRLHERIQLLGVDVKADDERLAKEIAFAVQKSDIAEELVRLATHLKQFHSSLETAEDAIGRHLQFLCQEIQREINTLTAKAAETAIASLGLSFKTELDRVREQALNIE